jgi:hypothetical protein
MIRPRNQITSSHEATHGIATVGAALLLLTVDRSAGSTTVEFRAVQVSFCMQSVLAEQVTPW